MEVKYRERLGVACCSCRHYGIMLNDFGVCASCFTKATEEQINALNARLEPVVRTITITKPWPNGKLIFAACLMASVGTVFGLRWLGL